MNPKVSIITVVRNNRQVVEAIHSIREQALAEHVESIVIDGASTDGTLQDLQSIRSMITQLISERDNGIYDAMNKGLRLAHGEIIGLLNSDDCYADNQVLARVVEAFKDPKVDACYGDLVMVHPRDSGRILRTWHAGGFMPGSFRSGWMPPHPTFFVRRHIYEAYGMFDLSYPIAADFELMLRFLERHQTRVAYIPKVLVRMRAGGTSNGSLGNIRKANLECARAFEANGIKSSPAFIPLKLLRHVAQYFLRSDLSLRTFP